MHLGVLAGQESWEKKGAAMISVDGCTWFGKPRSKQSNQWLVDEIEYISEVRYKELRSGIGKTISVGT